MVQRALQDEPRRSRGVWGHNLAKNWPKIGPEISGQIAFRYRKNLPLAGQATRNPHQPQIGNRDADITHEHKEPEVEPEAAIRRYMTIT